MGTLDAGQFNASARCRRFNAASVLARPGIGRDGRKVPTWVVFCHLIEMPGCAPGWRFGALGFERVSLNTAIAAANKVYVLLSASSATLAIRDAAQFVFGAAHSASGDKSVEGDYGGFGVVEVVAEGDLAACGHFVAPYPVAPGRSCLQIKNSTTV